MSPFDNIRRVKEGIEYWSARDLMSLLEYKSWQRFCQTIESARDNINAVGANSNHHINLQVNMVKRPQGGGRRQIDYHLSRLACYHIALCSDSRNSKIRAEAKHYFAVKTREAEVVIPAQEREIMSLKLELAKAERDAALAQKALLDKREIVTQLHPPTVAALILGATIVTDTVEVEKVVSGATNSEGIGICTIAQKFGFGKNTKACWQWLDAIGMGKDSGYWQLRLSAVEHYKLDPDAYQELLQRWGRGVRQIYLGEYS